MWGAYAFQELASDLEAVWDLACKARPDTDEFVVGHSHGVFSPTRYLEKREP